MAREVYISTDIESDGPIPGPNSMLSIGAAAYSCEPAAYQTRQSLLGTFSANLETLPGAEGDSETMAWWRTQGDAWTACRENPQPPAQVMKNYVEWVDSFGGRPVFVGYPATFDFLFVYWYLRYFGLKSPFSFSALDIKSFAMAKLGSSFRETTKKNMPQRWFRNLPKHTHVAVDDAVEQGALFLNILFDKFK